MASSLSARTLRFRLPPFVGGRRGRLAWRKQVHQAALVMRRKSGVRFQRTWRLEVKIVLRLPGTELDTVDLDNQLKHILDALQGALAGEKRKTRRHKRVIWNDHRAFRVTIEKRPVASRHTRNGGSVTIRPQR